MFTMTSSHASADEEEVPDVFVGSNTEDTVIISFQGTKCKRDDIKYLASAVMLGISYAKRAGKLVLVVEWPNARTCDSCCPKILELTDGRPDVDAARVSQKKLMIVLHDDLDDVSSISSFRSTDE